VCILKERREYTDAEIVELVVCTCFNRLAAC
jgi:hypothetical protein